MKILITQELSLLGEPHFCLGPSQIAITPSSLTPRGWLLRTGLSLKVLPQQGKAICTQSWPLDHPTQRQAAGESVGRRLGSELGLGQMKIRRVPSRGTQGEREVKVEKTGGLGSGGRLSNQAHQPRPFGASHSGRWE